VSQRLSRQYRVQGALLMISRTILQYNSDHGPRLPRLNVPMGNPASRAQSISENHWLYRGSQDRLMTRFEIERGLREDAGMERPSQIVEHGAHSPVTCCRVI
jgi:hypothetical protein